MRCTCGPCARCDDSTVMEMAWDEFRSWIPIACTMPAHADCAMHGPVAS